MEAYLLSDVWFLNFGYSVSSEKMLQKNMLKKEVFTG
jgi:hypothetical protein